MFFCARIMVTECVCVSKERGYQQNLLKDQAVCGLAFD